MKYPPNRTFDQGTMQWVETPGRQLDYTFDSMGRPNTLTSPDPTTWIGGVTYNAAGQPTNIGGETRQYNTLGQLTRITNGSAFDEEYKYSTTGANNGRITSKKNHLSGEEVEYTYDSLQRLIKAETLGAGGWGSTYGYDGFGNLWSAAATKGYAPPINISINAANNRVVGQTYDANGNQAWGSSDYDVANRLWKAPEGTTPQYYGYDGGNKRVYKNRFLGYDGQTGNPIYDENLTFYGVGGERVGEYTATWESISGGSSYVLRFTEKKTLVWFGSKLLREGQWNIIQDRLGSVRYRQLAVSPFTVENADYYPYGGEKPSATTQGREKFATYLRDETGLDYADQRYHWPDSGRFMSPDPYQASGGAGAPGSWNRYTYVESDPVNSYDPRGLQEEDPNPGAQCFINGMGPYPLQFCLNPPPHVPPVQTTPRIVEEILADVRKTTESISSKAVDAVMDLGYGCQNFFRNLSISDGGFMVGGAHVIGGKSSASAYDALLYNASHSVYVNGFDRQGTLTLSQLGYGTAAGPFSPDPTAFEYLGSNHAVAMGGVGVILSQGFYSSSPLSQAQTLVHELLHVTWGESDIDNARRFGLTVPSGTGSEMDRASGAIAAWLAKDCQK